MKKMKFSLGMKIASLLSCVALVSMGFASWWILKLPETPTTSQGSFTAYEVETKKIALSTPDFTGSNATLIFGKPSSAVTEHWFRASTSVEKENLSATFKFTVSLKDVASEGGAETLSSTSKINDFLDNVTFEFAPDDDTATALAAVITGANSQSYINAPTVTWTYTVGGNTYTSDAEDTTLTYNTSTKKISTEIDMTNAAANEVTVSVTIAFTWGAAFGSTNPYAFYNNDANKTYVAATANAAAAAMAKIADLSGSNNYDITLTAVAK